MSTKSQSDDGRQCILISCRDEITKSDGKSTSLQEAYDLKITKIISQIDEIIDAQDEKIEHYKTTMTKQNEIIETHKISIENYEKAIENLNSANDTYKSAFELLEKAHQQQIDRLTNNLNYESLFELLKKAHKLQIDHLTNKLNEATKQIEELLVINKMHINHVHELETQLKIDK